jgi:hypothetical protein
MDKTIEELKIASDKAMEAYYKALDHSYAMLEQYGNAKLEYEYNKLDESPLYWELYTKFREAEALYTAAKEAEKAAEEVAHVAANAFEDADAAAETEYYATLKCTFCGELDSVCGGDHGDEMREICRERRY